MNFLTFQTRHFKLIKFIIAKIKMLLPVSDEVVLDTRVDSIGSVATLW